MDPVWFVLTVSVVGTVVVAAAPNIISHITRVVELRHERTEHYNRRKIEVLEKYTEKIFSSNYRPLSPDFYHICGIVHMYVPSSKWDQVDRINQLAIESQHDEARELLGVLLDELNMPNEKLMRFKTGQRKKGK